MSGGAAGTTDSPATAGRTSDAGDSAEATPLRVSVGASSGQTTGGDGRVTAAVRDANGVGTIPADDRLLAPDDTLYVVARPDLLRRVEAATSGETMTAGEGGATPSSRRD